MAQKRTPLLPCQSMDKASDVPRRSTRFGLFLRRVEVLPPALADPLAVADEVGARRGAGLERRLDREAEQRLEERVQRAVDGARLVAEQERLVAEQLAARLEIARAELAGLVEVVPAGALALQLLEDVAAHVPHHRAGEELLEPIADLGVALLGLPPREQRHKVVPLLERAPHQVSGRAIVIAEAVVERRLALGGQP